MSCLKNPKMYIDNLREAITKLNVFDHLTDAVLSSQKTEDVIWDITLLIENLGIIIFILS